MLAAYPNESWIATRTTGWIVSPAMALTGCEVKASFAGPGGSRGAVDPSQDATATQLRSTHRAPVGQLRADLDM